MSEQPDSPPLWGQGDRSRRQRRLGPFPQRPALARASPATGDREVVLEADVRQFSYGDRVVLRDVRMDIGRRRVTAIIGPSGCGKSTYLRCFNRMNDKVRGARLEGSIRYLGQDLYARGVRPIEVRRRIGMVFQKPNPFPKSIRANVAYGPRLLGRTDDLDGIVERFLRQAALWDEVKDDLDASALTLSGGQQQRLCIARALAVEPDVLLMDEPASALDPRATARIEDLILELAADLTIVIVTHNMQQASRISDETAFFTVDDRSGEPVGILVEFASTDQIFGNPRDPRTEEYVSGKVG